MLHMNQIDQIKELQREAYRPSEIGKRIKVDRKTVAHYMNRNRQTRTVPQGEKW